MAKYRARRRSFRRRLRRYASKPTIPLAVVMGLAPGVGRAIDGYNAEKGGGVASGLRGASNWMIRAYTGYDIPGQGWNFGELKVGLLPLILGIAIHRGVGGMLGVNRLLARTGVPLVRL